MKQHRQEDALLKFCAGQSSDYIARTAKWIEAEYPGSADRLLPRLRDLYRAARRREKTRD